MDATDEPRLILVVPPEPDAAAFLPLLRAAVTGHDVAAVLIPPAAELAGKLAPLVQEAGAAALILDDTRLAGHVKADGVQIETGLADLRNAVDSFRPKRIVGAGRLTSRHAAMEAGEIGADYVFFGRPHGDTHDAPHPKALDLAEWWSDLMEIPAAIMAGRSLDSIAEAAATGASFVAVGKAIWTHPEGAAAAVAQAQAALRPGRRAA